MCRAPPSSTERVAQPGAEVSEVLVESPRRWALPDAGERWTAHPTAPVCRPQLGHGATGDGHGEGLAGLDATQDFAHLVAQLLLRDGLHPPQGSTSEIGRASCRERV